MNLDDILKYESTYVEFKQQIDMRRPKNWLKKLCAFANGRRPGYMVIGITDVEKEIVGVDNADEVITKIRELTKTYIEDPIYPEIITKDISGKTIIIVKVESGNDAPYFLNMDNQLIVYINNGNETIRADIQTVRKLVYRGYNISWDADLTDLSKDDYTFHYLKDKFREIRKETLTEQDLEEFKLVKGDKITNMGILFSDQNKNPNAWISVTRWNGLDKADYAIDDKEWRGSILQQVDNAKAFAGIYNQLQMHFIDGQIQRKEMTSYNDKSIREAIVNAVTHRDYLVHNNMQVEVAIYDDRLVVKSVGDLHKGATLEELLSGATIGRRNENICRIFKELDYIEQRGRGIDKMFGPYPDDKKPVIRVLRDTFIITFYSMTYNDTVNVGLNGTVNDTVNDGVNDGVNLTILEKYVYKRINENFDITVSELAKEVNKSKSTLERALRNLQQHKYIKREGSDKTGRWVVLK